MDDDKQSNDNNDQPLDGQVDNNQPVFDQVPESQNNFSQSEEHVPGTFITKGTKTKRRLRLGKKPTIVILIILALLVGVGVVYWFVIKDSNKSSNQPTQANNSTQKSSADDTEPESPKDLVADNVIYAYRVKDTDPVGLYWRPAGGGERNLVMTITDGNYMGYSDVRGQYVAFNTSAGSASESVWFSNDSGKNYKKIFSAESGKSITSVKISINEARVVVGQSSNSSQPAEAIEINPENSESKKLFSADTGGVFVRAYDSKNQKIIYSEGCWGCDGNLGNTVFYKDMSKGTTKELIKSSDIIIKELVAVNSDFTEALVRGTTKDDSIAPTDSFYGFYLGAPYSLISVDIASGQEKSLATFGEKQTNSSAEALYSSVGYMADSKTPYYVLDKRIFMVKSSGSSLLFESPSAIYSEYFVSANDVVMAVGPYNNFNVINYLLKDQKNNQVLSGDDKTTILGVTTK